MAKWMWIIAGPNGAGKSTFTNQFLADLGHVDLVKLNADERTLMLRSRSPRSPQNELNLKAAIEIDAEVAANIDAGRSFLVETVLSSDKYRDDVLAAKAKGFRIGLIYVSLYPPRLSPQRVSERAAKGGHDVDPAKAIDRYRRSHRQLRWFAEQADILFAFDNSPVDGEPTLVAQCVPGQPLRLLVPGCNPSLDRALSTSRRRPRKSSSKS